MLLEGGFLEINLDLHENRLTTMAEGNKIVENQFSLITFTALSMNHDLFQKASSDGKKHTFG